MNIDDRMFDFKDFYSRIAKELPDNCKVIEIGVADGHSMLFLAQKLKETGKKFKVYGVDNMDYGGLLQAKTIYENIIKSGLGEYIEIVPYDSLTASTMFNDNYLDFIYIDSSHEYESTKKEIAAWYPKCKDEGIISGHDYFCHEGVKKAVDETIPKNIKRETIDTPEQFQEFEEERFLHTEQTSNEYGVWWCIKDFYKKLNDIK